MMQGCKERGKMIIKLKFFMFEISPLEVLKSLRINSDKFIVIVLLLTIEDDTEG